jgi:hypothetical protein
MVALAIPNLVGPAIMSEDAYPLECVLPLHVKVEIRSFVF